MEKINVRKLSKAFGRLKILESISFCVKEGEFLSIIGPSGCGKTTLLNCIQGFIKDYKGELTVNGKKGFIFQDNGLLPWKTVEGNVAIGPENSGVENVKKRVNSVLKEVGLFKFRKYYPHQISEGMKQRVGIARCIVNQPDILLMDEPFNSLDYFTRLRMQDLIIKIRKKRKLTVLLVTHNVDEAIRMSDRIIVLNDKPARIKYIGKDKKKIMETIQHYTAS